MATNEDIHKDIYARMNDTDRKLSESIGKWDVIISQNERLINLLGRAIFFMFVLAMVELAAIIYGAIGKEGLHAVRQAVPISGTADANGEEF